MYGIYAEAFTYPPRKAPTGRLTGTAVASCDCDRVVWNDLLRNGDCVRRERVEKARRGTSTREAMVTEAVERLFGGGGMSICFVPYV
jgi:hypothetical protein